MTPYIDNIQEEFHEVNEARQWAIINELKSIGYESEANDLRGELVEDLELHHG